LIGIAANKLAFEWFEGKELITATAINLAGFPVGISLAFALLGQFNTGAEWQISMYLATGISFIVLLLVWIVVQPAVTTHNLSVEFVNRREFWLSLVIGCSWGSVNAALITMLAFLPPLLVRQNIDLVTIGIILATGPLIAILSIPLGGMLVDRTGRPGLMVVLGLGVWALLMPLVIPFAGTVWIVLTVIIITSLAGAAPSGVIVASVGTATRPQSRAVAMGLFFTLFYALGLAAPPLAGLAVDLSARPALPMFMVVGWLLFAMASYGLFRWLMARGPSAVSMQA
jgi:MFS family permease